MANKEYASRVAKQYAEEVVPALTKKFGYKNPMEVPKLVKIVISSGLGDIKDNAKSIQLALNEIKQITGQQPILTKAKKSVANFKVREGMSVGIKVTLRNSATSAAYPQTASTARATTTWASRNSSSSPRSSTIRSKRSAAWTYALSPRPRPTRKRENF